jgi:hypothetical protein
MSKLVELSLRAWAPVFASIEQALCRDIFDRLYGDWRKHQEQSVRDSVTSDGMRLGVRGERGVIGFVAAKPDCKRRTGEVDHAEKTRDEPDVVTSLPTTDRRKRTPVLPLTPTLRRLPRP